MIHQDTPLGTVGNTNQSQISTKTAFTTASQRTAESSSTRAPIPPSEAIPDAASDKEENVYLEIPNFTSWDPQSPQDAWSWPDYFIRAFSTGELVWIVATSTSQARIQILKEREDLLAYFQSMRFLENDGQERQYHYGKIPHNEHNQMIYLLEEAPTTMVSICHTRVRKLRQNAKYLADNIEDKWVTIDETGHTVSGQPIECAQFRF
ncbi:hypothetical protein MMC13_005083 [Lambiella insularis]|nr:hypothetical protein [Lambiella insularis]